MPSSLFALATNLAGESRMTHFFSLLHVAPCPQSYHLWTSVNSARLRHASWNWRFQPSSPSDNYNHLFDLFLPRSLQEMRSGLMPCYASLGTDEQPRDLISRSSFTALEATSMHDASPSVLRFLFSERNVHLNLSALDWLFTSLPSSEPVSGIKLDADGMRDLVRSFWGSEPGLPREWVSELNPK